MKMKSAVILLLAACFVQTTICVPIASKEVENSEEEITDESEDPCNLEEFEDIAECDVDDKECLKNSNEKHEKIKSLCAEHPNCSFCGNKIDAKVTDDEELLEVTPEIVTPISDESDEDLDELRAPPNKLIERNIIIENDNETHYYRGFIESGANITTVIRLTNVIKNENIINMPTTLNNTNINNIHIYNNKTSEVGGKFGLGYSEDGPCCFAAEKKNCKQSTAGTKCRHNKKRVCGQQCTSKIIHPKKNPCMNIPQWPFVVCPNSPQQPGFYPPQYYPAYNPMYPPGFPAIYPPGSQSIDEFDDDEDLPLFPEDDLLKNPEAGWVVGPEKCKIVSEDGLQIFNCTNKGIEFEHPFARNTDTESVKRDARHAVYPNSPQNSNSDVPQMPQMPFYPVMYQPVIVMQPMPFYPPQFYPQQAPINYYQPNQIPYPPTIESKRDDETHETKSHQKHRRNSRKHHPIIMETEDEL